MIGKGMSLQQWGLLIIGSILSIISGCSGCSSDSDSGTSDTSVRISGVVLDPYIAKARVWCDLNTNAVYDDGTDPSVLTNDQGKYEFEVNICVDKTIIVDGMEDTTHVDTNGNVISKFTGRMKAASGSGFVTPLTSLQQTLVESGKTVEEARQKVAKALGLVDTTGAVLDIDFNQLDISANDQKQAQKAAIVAQQLLLDTTAAMQGVSGAPMTPSSFEAMTNSLADTIANAQHPLIKENGGLDPVAVRQTLQSTVEEAVKKEQQYTGFDAANIVQAIGDAVVVNSQQAATVVDESGDGNITAEKLMQSQSSGSEMIRVTMDTIKTYVNGSGDFDGDGSADIGQGVANAGDLIEELKNVLLAVSSGLAEAVSTETKDVITSSTVSNTEVKSVIANVVQNTVGLALDNMNLKHVAARVIEQVDNAIDNGSIEGLGDVTKNKAPKAMNGTLTVRSGQSKSARLHAKDLNEQDTLTFSIATDSTGKVTLNGDGSYTFNASELTSGSYSFTFNVTDGVATDTGTVKIAVLGTNLNPVVQDLAIMLRQEDSLSGSFSAIDFDGDDLSYQFITNPKNMFSLDGDIYTISSVGIAAGFYTANYSVTDTSGGESFGEIVVEVMSLDKNNPPMAFNGSLELQQGAKGTGKFRAADPDLTDTLEFSILSSNSSLFELNPTTGEYTFDATDQAVGVYTATFQVSDGTEKDTATLTITVKSQNDNLAPVARDSFIELIAGTTDNNGMLLATDFDAGDSLSYALSSAPEQGSVTVNSDGSFSFNASGVAAGLYGFTFKVTDSHGASATGKVTVIVMATNLPPKALDGRAKVDRSTSTSLSAKLVALDDGKPSALIYEITSNDGGRAVLTNTGAADGSFTFNVTEAALGLHEIGFTVFDGELYGDGTFTIMVVDSSLSDIPPQAVDSSMTVVKGSIGNGNFVAVDDGASGSLTFAITDSAGERAKLTDTGATDGSFTFNAENTDPGTYTVKFSVLDQNNSLSNGVVMVTVVAPLGSNNPPVAKNSELTLNPEEVVKSHFIARDRDGDTLTFSIVASAGLNVSLLDENTGAYQIDASGGMKGLLTITFSVSDGKLEDTGAVAVLIRNSAPIASDASFEVNSGDTLSGTLTATDINGADTLVFTKLTDPVKGAVTVNEDGTFTFNAADVEAGTYSFDFQASDGTVSDTGTVTVTVLAVTPDNNPPVASDGSLTVTSGESANGTLSVEDKDSDTLTYAVVAQPSQGTVTVNSNGTYSFDATSAEAGSYTFTFKANDGKADSNTATITVTVKAASVNNAPVAQNGILLVLAGSTKSGVLQASDGDGDSLTFTKLTDPSSGVVTVEANGSYTFDASNAANGVYTFTFQVSDGTATSDGTVTVTVGSFLQVSQVMLNQTDHTVAGFQSSGATVSLPLTSFGFNLQAMGKPGTDMSVELGLSMSDDGGNKTIQVIVNNVNLSVLSNGALKATVSSNSQATVSYSVGTTSTDVTVQNTSEDMVNTSAAGAATTLSMNLGTLFDRVRAKATTTGWPLVDTSVEGVFTSTGVVKVTNQSSQQVNVKDKADNDLSNLTVTIGGTSVSGPGITGKVTLQ